MSETAIAAPAIPASTSPAVNAWIIALVVTMATFMEVLDTSIANVSLPHIAGGLSAGVDESTWILTSYLVSNAIILPMSGWFSNLMGRKRFYMMCVAVFTISSFLCGLAPRWRFRSSHPDLGLGKISGNQTCALLNVGLGEIPSSEGL